MNFIKKAYLHIRYGATRTEATCFIVIIVAAVWLFVSEAWRIAFIILIGFSAIALILAKRICDRSHRYSNIWKSLFSRNFTITQKKERELKKHKNGSECPKKSFKNEINNIIGNIEKGDVYKTVTHARVIKLIEGTPLYRAGRLEITKSKSYYVESLRKYEKDLFSEGKCSECKEECWIKKAKELKDFSDEEKFYGVIMKGQGGER